MITLTSDFGSPYPAAMRGAILQRSDARLVDIAHDLPRQDVRSAAFWLREVLPYFPPAVHCVVVDPGVGTERAAIVIRAGDHALVGPDNGVLLPVVRELANDDAFDVFDIAYSDTESNTFHGRDVFAPTAARVHEAGIDAIETLDGVMPVDEWVDLTFPTPVVGESTATGEVLVIDDFGNVITNIPGGVLDELETIHINGSRAPVADSYAAVEPGQRLVTVGSHGNLECAVNQGRGDQAFDLAVGDRVTADW
ncbi:MAG: S-adenosyl-l-methionine hydroxide adenosyltransferase family protein [Halobacteriales archaeon]